MNANMSLNDHIIAHCNDSMKKPLSAERHPLWMRSCPEMSDIDFVRFGLLRGIENNSSGLHFLQTRGNVYDEQLPVSTYFNSLKSARRMHMLESLEQQSYKLNCKTLESHGINYLKQFPELDQYTVEAADGHFIDHACHTEKGTNEKVLCCWFYLLIEPPVWAIKTAVLCDQWNNTKS